MQIKETALRRPMLTLPNCFGAALEVTPLLSTISLPASAQRIRKSFRSNYARKSSGRTNDTPQRMLWVTIGLVATACGIAGAILPLVPTTPFLLLAVYALARSSPRLHVWLITHPRLGPPIRDWNSHGAIRRGAKIAAIIVMAASKAISAAAGVRLALILLQATALTAAACFILSRPTAIEE